MFNFNKKNMESLLNFYRINSKKIPLCKKNNFKELFYILEKLYWKYFSKIKNSNIYKLSYKLFCKIIFLNSELLDFYDDFELTYEKYNKFKKEIPVRGCIVVSKNRDKILLVKNRFSNSWCFPKGKINSKETDWQCAKRETYEETGLKVSKSKSCCELNINGRNFKLYLVEEIDEDYNFSPIDQDEISDVKFFEIDNVPEKTNYVVPFLNSIKKLLNS